MESLDRDIRPWLIDRPRLLHRMEALQASSIVLVAPAGYGKSTLARQFVSRDRGHAWFHCTKASVDAGRLGSDLKRALAPSDDRSDRAFERDGDANVPPDGSVLASLLDDSVEVWPANAWFVIDDYEQIIGDDAAQTLLGRLALDQKIRTIVASRVRPSWLTARRLAYGDVVEIDAKELALTGDEAASVFRAVGRHPAKELVALADGWPAALTLVALGGSDAKGVTGTLEEFVAEEVCRPFSPEVRADLCLLAGLATLDSGSVSVMLGSKRAERCLMAARDAGVVERIAESRFEFHPLVRDYLRSQPLDADSERHWEEVGERLAASGRWDDLYDIARRVGGEPLLALLLTRGVRVALDEGRPLSVRRWLEYARRNRMCGMLATLGEAELALREGYYVQSEILSAEVAADLQNEPTARTWGLFIAGRAAHLAGREQKAVDYYRMARSSATTDAEAREADWGELTGAIDLELPEAAVLLEQLRSSEQTTAADRVEVASRSLMLGARLGSLAALDTARTVLQVVPHVSDPVARSSFLNTFAYASAIAGEYHDALDALEALEADVESQKLLFALPYVACGRAVVLVAQRNFDPAFEVLASAAIEGRRVADSHVLGMCAAIRSRGLIALGQFTEASAVASYRHPSLIKSMQGELLITRSLALVCAGEDHLAVDLANEANVLTTAVEVIGIDACIRAILASRSDSPHAEEMAASAVTFALDARYVDGLIAAYRGFPELAQRIASMEEHAEWFTALMKRANDDELAQVAGLGRKGGEHHLSPREAEVFVLLRQGLSNREIGARLFISEGTAKQHVRKILRKLGVRTRVEAALRVPPPA